MELTAAKGDDINQVTSSSSSEGETGQQTAGSPASFLHISSPTSFHSFIRSLFSVAAAPMRAWLNRMSGAVVACSGWCNKNPLLTMLFNSFFHFIWSAYLIYLVSSSFSNGSSVSDLQLALNDSHFPLIVAMCIICSFISGVTVLSSADIISPFCIFFFGYSLDETADIAWLIMLGCMP